MIVKTIDSKFQTGLPLPFALCLLRPGPPCPPLAPGRGPLGAPAPPAPPGPPCLPGPLPWPSWSLWPGWPACPPARLARLGFLVPWAPAPWPPKCLAFLGSWPFGPLAAPLAPCPWPPGPPWQSTACQPNKLKASLLATQHKTQRIRVLLNLISPSMGGQGGRGGRGGKGDKGGRRGGGETLMLHIEVHSLSHVSLAYIYACCSRF